WAASLLFGGEYPGSGFLSRLFTVHVFLIPTLLAGLIGVHLLLVARQHHTQFPGRGRYEGNVIGLKLWPAYATKSVGLFFLVAGVLAVMGGTLQINPVWLYGPYDPFTVSSASQADWYVLWLQGALRLMPGVEVELFGNTLANQFFPGVLLPALMFGIMLLWPFLEARVTGDRDVHHLLDRPRDRPVRSGIGAAGLAFTAVLLLAGADDVIAASFDWPIVTLRLVERGLLVVAPLAVGVFTAKVCADLRRRDPLPAVVEAPPHEAGPLGSEEDARGPSRLSRLRRRVETIAIAGALLAAIGRRARDQG
ncbi:MAG: cytochrome b N-terminal domain-containing protein, partial [Egibacteraceae bacterium]